MTRRCCPHRRHEAGICLSGFCACQRPMTPKASRALARWSMAQADGQAPFDAKSLRAVNNGRIAALRRARADARGRPS